MPPDRSTAIRRALLAVALLAGVWAFVIAVTGGFGVSVAGLRVSSRNVRNPLLLAVLAACAALALSRRHAGVTLADDLAWRWAAARRASRAWSDNRWTLWIDPASAAALGGAALLVHQWLRARPLWLDEEMIALNIRDRGLAELGGALWLDQSAPLGWLATERVATLLFGTGEVALRSIPVAFAVAALAAAGWIGRQWLTPAGACTLVSLLALGQWVSHYSLELKPYSADIFFGLLLPGLVLWVFETEDSSRRMRRAASWWAAAALGLWWANGVVMVTPACATALAVLLWRRDGARGAVVCAVAGFGWLASFSLHYLAAMRFTLANKVLQDTWAFALPPQGAGVAERAAWVAGHAAPFAATPGGSGLSLLFWAVVLCGVLAGRPRILAYLAAGIPLTACVLAAVRLVPLYERFSVWTVPALYAAIALSVDTGIRGIRGATASGRASRLALPVALVAAALWLSLDIGARGWTAVTGGRPADSNHQLDDRTAVRWLLAQRRPGDAVVTTVLALPALWWYGRVAVSPPILGTAMDGSPILEAFYQPAGADCEQRTLDQALARSRRALVYFGFRFDDVPDGFDDLLLHELARVGRITASQRFAGLTRAVVVALDGGPAADGHRPGAGAPLPGCVSVRAAKRW